MQSVNLIPGDYTRTRRSRRRLLVSGALALSLLLALSGFARLLHQTTTRALAANAALENELRGLESDRARLAATSQILRDLSQKIELVQTLSHNRRWATYLAHIARSTPDEVVLSRAHIIPATPAPQPAPLTPSPSSSSSSSGASTLSATPDPAHPDRLVLLLEGYALNTTDITRFVAGLGSAGLFAQITFKGSLAAQINGKALNRFNLECPIRYEPRKKSASTHSAASVPSGSAPLASRTARREDRP